MQILTEFTQYMPHGMCLLWQPWLLILWGGADFLIFLSYFAIPIALLSVLHQRGDLKFSGLVWLFAAFIMLCGLTHALSIVTLWVPIYPLQGFVKLATGLVSATTALVLFRLVPTLVAIPSPGKLEEANRMLREEVAAHEATLTMLRQARDNLEVQVEERTAELNQVNAKLAITAHEAVHRSRNLISVVSSMARQSARGASKAEDFINAYVGRLNALSVATATVLEGSTRASADLGDVVRTQLEPVTLTYSDRVVVEGPVLETGSEAAQQISLAVHELATNAQKYGSLSVERGKIRVSWSVEGDSDESKRLLLRWEEDISETAARPAIEEEKTGFGTRLITQIVPATLRGEASLTLRDGILIYELNVPLAAIAMNNSRSASRS